MVIIVLVVVIVIVVVAVMVVASELISPRTQINCAKEADKVVQDFMAL